MKIVSTYLLSLKFFKIIFDCLTILHLNRCLDSSLDKLTSLLNENDSKITKKQVGKSYNLSTKKLAHPFDFFHDIEDFEKTDQWYLKKIIPKYKRKNQTKKKESEPTQW